MSEHPGLEFAPPPIATSLNFNLDFPSSVIYNLYGLASIMVDECIWKGGGGTVTLFGEK